MPLHYPVLALTGICIIFNSMKERGNNAGSYWSRLAGWITGSDAGPIASLLRIVGVMVSVALIVLLVTRTSECDF